MRANRHPMLAAENHIVSFSDKRILYILQGANSNLGVPFFMSKIWEVNEKPVLKCQHKGNLDLYLEKGSENE